MDFTSFKTPGKKDSFKELCVKFTIITIFAILEWFVVLNLFVSEGTSDEGERVVGS